MGLGALLRRSGDLGGGRPFFRGRELRPTRFVATLPDLAPADPARAEDIYAGVFALAGETLATRDVSPFAAPAPSDAFAAELHGFGWLRDLAAAGTAVARTNARALVDEWLRAERTLPRLARAPEVEARRLRAFLAHGPFLLRDSPDAFRARFLALLADHIRRLDRAVGRLGGDPARLDAAIAVAAAALVLDLARPFGERAARRLGGVLDRQVLPDGGTPSRRPDDVLDVLAALLPVLRVARERGRALPPEALAAADRMAPLLRFFLRADGTLAAFNGTGPTRRALLERVLAATREAGAAPSNARYCGYQRLAAGDVVLLADTGAIPPRAFAGRAHAAPLAFELSDGSGPIVVNCGAAPEGTPPELAMALRGTAAHSTLIVAEVSMAPLRHERQDARGRARLVPDGGPERVDVERHARDGRIVVQAAHDGWRRRFGLVHARTLALEADGSALSGRDSLTGPGAGAGQPFAIRFHLHPAIKTSVSPSGRAVVLTAADGTIWRFGVREEVELAVEESLFVEPQGRVARTCQIRLSADVATQPVVRWRFERLLAGRPAAADAPAYVPPVDGSDF